MIIKALSDIHGRLPSSGMLGPCDVLILAGDICPFNTDHTLDEQSRFISGPFAEWCDALPTHQILVLPGNHDFLFESGNGVPVPEPHPKVTYLIDNGIDLPNNGPGVWGYAWIHDQPDWAFHAEADKHREVLSAIPPDYDIWLMHAPPLCELPGYHLDVRDGVHLGNPHALAAIAKRSPQLIVSGHVHRGFSVGTLSESLVANAAFLTSDYEPAWRYIEIGWDEAFRSVRSVKAVQCPEPVLDSSGLYWDCVKEGWS